MRVCGSTVVCHEKKKSVSWLTSFATQQNARSGSWLTASATNWVCFVARNLCFVTRKKISRLRALLPGTVLDRGTVALNFSVALPVS